MIRRRHFKQTRSFQDRLALFAKDAGDATDTGLQPPK